MPGPRSRTRRSGLACVSGLQRSSRLFLGLVGGAVAHQGRLVRCRLLARDGALLVAGALDDVVLGRERRRGDNQRKRRDSQFEFHASRPLQPIRKDLVIRFRRQRLAREAIMAAKEMSVKKYVVRLSGEERERLETLLRKGKSPARRVLKARILLKADVSEAGKGWSDNRIIEALETSPSMVYRVRKQLVEEGFEAVLSRKPRAMPAIARIFDGEKEAKLIALACSKPPTGRARWTLRLLENKVVELGIVDRASDSTIGRALKKTLFSPIAASTGSSRRRLTARS